MESRTALTEQFKKAYNSLNDAQRTAVDAIEGPVMVIAGPGTGKTQILAVRIGNILLQTDALPENILCLTYTEAGAIAMRNRLLSFIGPDAYRVQIQTFHAFCNEIIQSHPDLFGRRELEPVSELEQVMILENILRELPSDHVLRRFRDDLSSDIRRLGNLFRIMKEEDWSPEWIANAIQAYLDSLPDRPEFIYKVAVTKKGVKAGDVKQDKIDQETAAMEKLQAAANLFPVFQEKMAEAGRFDYSDMILWVVRAFARHPDLLRTYQERFLYVLVDEYQDTNGAQNEILRSLIGYWDVPNVFVVGDDDQSIYEFQGARVQNILDLYRQYENDMRTVLLTENYRSVQPVLDVSRILIDRNEERLVSHLEGLSKVLISRGEEVRDLTQLPVIRAYDSKVQEEAGVLMEIEKLLESGTDPAEIAVIYYRHAQADQLIRLMGRKQLPYALRKQLNSLDVPLVRQILSVMEYAGKEHRQPNSAEHLLFEMLYFPFFGIHRHDILSLAAYMQGKRTNNNWRQVIADPDLMAQVKLRDPEALQKLESRLTLWISEAGSLTLPMLLEKIFEEGGVLAYIIAHHDRFFLLEAMHAFFDYVQAESAADPEMRVEDLLEQLNLMRRYHITLPVWRTFGNRNGVQFVTCHSAKGLEFDHVFLIGCNSNQWESSRRNSNNFSLPDTLTFSGGSNELEAQRRLFYVALTRARKGLQVSYAETDNNAKTLEPSRFVEEMAVQDLTIRRSGSLDDEKLAAIELLSLGTDKTPTAELFDPDWLTRKTEHLSLSASMLNAFLKCPVRFYFQYLLRIPQARNDSMEFGNAIHLALQRYFNEVRETGNFPPPEKLVQPFRLYMQQHREAFTDKQFRNRMELGEMILPEYYAQHVSSWNKVVVTEYPVRDVTWKNIPINGKLDKIEFNGNEVHVVDYKTGSYRLAKQKMKGPTDKDPLGGEYWRQMVFYQILMNQQRQKPWRMVSGEFDFLEKNPDSGKYEKERLVITSDDTAIVGRQIEEVYGRIRSLDFTEGCNEPDCEYCNLLKYE